MGILVGEEALHPSLPSPPKWCLESVYWLGTNQRVVHRLHQPRFTSKAKVLVAVDDTPKRQLLQLAKHQLQWMLEGVSGPPLCGRPNLMCLVRGWWSMASGCN